MKDKHVLLIMAFVGFVFFLIISCAKTGPAGPLGVSTIQLTHTPTCTPDIVYTVYIHQDATPAANVGLTLFCMEKGVTLTAKTGPDGKAGFSVHNNGQWNLAVDTFNGFKNQYFQVEPLSNTFYAVNYGIPTLDLELVSGSETLGIHPAVLVYRAVYHTKFERLQTISINKKTILDVTYSYPATVNKDGDNVMCTISIPKSYEGYDTEDKYLNFAAVCSYNNLESTVSNQRTLTKNWNFRVSTEFHYIQFYDFADNNGRVTYYGAIKNTNFTLNSPGYNTTSISYEIIGAANTGSDGTGTPVNPGTCMPSFTNYGCYNALVKIPTNAVFETNFKHDNNGWISVRFYDGTNFDITRTFSTNNAWNTMICAHWCCTSGNITRSTYTCMNNLSNPFSTCFAIWDHFALADMIRERTGSITITK